MVNGLASSVVDRVLEFRFGAAGTIGICCFSAKYAASRRKSKDRLALNHDNV